MFLPWGQQALHLSQDQGLAHLIEFSFTENSLVSTQRLDFQRPGHPVTTEESGWGSLEWLLCTHKCHFPTDIVKSLYPSPKNEPQVSGVPKVAVTKVLQFPIFIFLRYLLLAAARWEELHRSWRNLPFVHTLALGGHDMTIQQRCHIASHDVLAFLLFLDLSVVVAERIKAFSQI